MLSDRLHSLFHLLFHLLFILLFHFLFILLVYYRVYGNFICVISVFKNVLQFLNENSIEKLIVKTIPSFYSDYFSEEIEYCLFIVKAQLYRRDALSVLDLTKNIAIASNRMEGVKRGIKNELSVKEESNFELFWNEILIPKLA